MTSDILQNILSEEAQASEIHLEAQQTANEIVKNAEARAGDEERKAAVENRALYQRLLEERRLRVEQQLQNHRINFRKFINQLLRRRRRDLPKFHKLPNGYIVKLF